MVPSYHATLTQLLTDPSVAEWQLAPQVLHQAFAWCAMLTTSSDMNDADTALDFLISLKQALQQGDTCLDNVGTLIERADPGQALKKALEQRHKDLAAGSDQLNELNKTISKLRSAEAELNKQNLDRKRLEADKVKLSKRLKELDRLSKLAQHVEELRKQLAIAERNRSATECDAEDLEAQLAKQTEQFLTLAPNQLEYVQEQVRSLLQKAEQCHSDLQQNYRAWQEVAAHYADLEAAFQQHVEVLRLYQQADRMVSEALGTQPEVHSAEELLQRVGHFLEEADSILAKVLEAQARAEEVQRFYVVGGA
ncbi:MAG: hypothetical protein EOM24_02110 [Chloroflexia bacterium]|nr:hypothetical protein [Chloroflexia bacterium]